MKRYATAHWQGKLREGKGTLTTESSVLNKAAYSYETRFEQGIGTNPEELVAAAHAGCFTMQLSADLTKAGFVPDNIDTRCDITFENGEITESNLTVKARVTGIENDKFQEIVEAVKKNCPISKLLNCTISCKAELAEGEPAKK